MVGLLHLQGRRALLGSEAVAGLGALAEVNSNFRRSPGLLEPHVFSINYFFFENLKKDRNKDEEEKAGLVFGNGGSLQPIDKQSLIIDK